MERVELKVYSKLKMLRGLQPYLKAHKRPFGAATPSYSPTAEHPAFMGWIALSLHFLT
ncbi:MAG: hypothetical protein QW176_00105 [Candidatus Bathyarchaeia archaeon]